MSRTLLKFGPPAGVRNTTEPYDDAATSDFCQDAQNVYFRDPSLESGAQARPGFNLHTPGTGLGTMQGLHTHTALDGTVYNFTVQGGKIYRLDSTLSLQADVTPGTVAIDISAYHVSLMSVGDVIVITDGVHRPWVASALGATPITGAYIDIDGVGGSWTAFGPPTIYQDGAMFITLTVPGGSPVTPRIGLVWSEPNQPTVGYTQSGYADFFNVIEQGTDPLTAIWGTNIGVFYWREMSVGVLVGTLPNLSTTATRDARAFNVGTITPWSIAQFGSNIFFNDAQGRVWMLPLTGIPEPVWKQMAAVITAVNTTAATPANLVQFANAAVVPELDLYANVIYGTGSGEPVIFDVFDGRSGNYCGRWEILVGGGIALQIESMGILKESTGASSFTVAGTGGGLAGTVMTLNRTNVTGALWKDCSLVSPTRYVTTDRLGYAAGTVYNGDTATIITMSDAPVTVTVTTPYTASTVEGTAVAPGASLDGTYRTVVGLDVAAARGMTVKVQPTTATAQWGFQRVEVTCVTANAGPEDL